MFGGREHLSQDDEAENVRKMWHSDSSRPINLRDGSTISPKGIAEIGDPETIPYRDGYPLNKDGRSYMRDGVRVYLEPKSYDEIKYKLHPKYKKMIEEIEKRDGNLKIEEPKEEKERRII